MEINGNTEIDKSEIQTQQILTDIDILSAEYQPPCWIVPGLLPALSAWPKSSASKKIVKKR